MPEPNGEIPLTGDPHVDAALKRLRERGDARLKDLEDALLVQINLERRSRTEHSLRFSDLEAVQRLQQNAIARQEIVLERHQTFLEDHARIMRDIDTRLAEITDKLNLMISREMRREGGPETQG